MNNAVDKKMAFETLGVAFIQYYEKFSPILHEIDEIAGEPNWYDSFDWSAKEYSKLHPKGFDAMKLRNEYIEKVLAQAS